MKAEIKPRIELENRTKLEDVIPMETPFVLFLDPSDICNFRCKFCPTSDAKLMKKHERPTGRMDFDLYKKIIDDLSDFENKLKVLRLYKDGEPLLNPKLADMINYAKESGCALQIDTTTNASLLTPEKNLELISAGLDRINISINGLSDHAYLQFTRYKIKFENLVDNIRHFFENRGNCKVCIKIVGDNLTSEEKERFFTVFGDIADRVFIEHIAPCWPEFEMKEAVPNPAVGIYGQPIREVEVCPYIFYSLSVNSDGKVSLCFLDWSRKMIIGDLKSESLRNIWNGKTLFNYQKMHLSKNRKSHQICGKCCQLSHCLPDDIDAYAEMLLDRLDKGKT